MNIHKATMKNKKEAFYQMFQKERKKVIIFFVFIIILFSVFYADNIQQKRFDSLRQAYENVRNEEYSEAAEKFENYLNVDSKIYWYLIDHVNDYSYSRQAVIDARNECIQKMEN